MATHAEIVDQMRRGLAVSIPDLDTSVGTPVRKWIDVVAEGIAESYVDRHLITYQYDIDSMAGADLDSFVELFGLNRLAARRATGTVTFARVDAYTQPIVIPVGTQVADDQNPPLIFSTILAATLSVGDTSVEVPVQAVEGGSAGNVQPGAISKIVTPLPGISSLSNTIALTGGSDEEADDALRKRFRRTALRHLAGTEAMYLGIALEDPDVLRVNVVGSYRRRYEQIELDSGTGTSTVQDAQYVFPDRETVGPSIYEGDILTPVTHYTFDDTVLPPTLDSNDAGDMPDGIYDVEFDYLPEASRNDPANDKMNCVDVFVDGVRATEATETLEFSLGATFNTTGGSPMHRDNFRRTNEAKPTSGNIFTQLGYCPLLDLPGTLTVAGEDYVEGTDYWLINEVAPGGMGAKSRCGIEWLAANHPASGDQVTVTYSFNAVPGDLDVALRSWRLVTQDAMAHQAKLRLIDMHLVLILSPGYSVTDPSRVTDEVYARIKRFVDATSFASVLQVSDLLAEVHLVPGVDAVRFRTDDDHATDYAMQWVTPTGSVLQTYDDGGATKRVTDAYFADDELPVLNEVTYDIRAQNRYNVGA